MSKSKNEGYYLADTDDGLMILYWDASKPYGWWECCGSDEGYRERDVFKSYPISLDKVMSNILNLGDGNEQCDTNESVY